MFATRKLPGTGAVDVRLRPKCRVVRRSLGTIADGASCKIQPLCNRGGNRAAGALAGEERAGVSRAKHYPITARAGLTGAPGWARLRAVTALIGGFVNIFPDLKDGDFQDELGS